jgi:hypothetical protein
MFKAHLRRECLGYALLAVVLGSGWQTTLVYSLYGGNWSALFYHGRAAGGIPNEPAFANTYVFPDEFGFDGQYYRIIAHDPFLTRGYFQHIERPVMRYRRILVPFLAFALACGRQPYIDTGFIATMLLFFFLGVYWLARYAELSGRSAKWGWAFILAPATLAGLERGAIDTALTALTIGFALYLREQSRYRLFLVLVMAGLCRETGLCLCLACAGASLLKRDWRMLALSCASMLPSFAWYGYVQMHCPADPSSNLLRLPLTDLVQNLLHHDASYVNSGRSFVEVLYYMAVFGMLLAFFLAIRFAFKDWTSAEGLAALAFTMTGLLLQPSGLWVQPYYFGRVLAPLLVLLGLRFFAAGDWRNALPACMVSPAILLVSAASALRVAKHLRM